jgi:hypothetical protein
MPSGSTLANWRHYHAYSLSKLIVGSLAALALGVSVATTPALAHGGGGGGAFHGGFGDRGSRAGFRDRGFRGGVAGYYGGYGYCGCGYGYYGYGNCFAY